MKRVSVGDFRLGEEEKKAIMDVLDSGRISEGPKVREFEREWAKFVGTKHAVLVSSGTAAIMCGLTALKYYKNIEDCSKVITSPTTYIATSNAIVASKLEPVYVDVDKENFCITAENIKELLENANQGGYSIILPVHLMGYLSDMKKINGLAKKYGLFTFEDASQAHGTENEDVKKAGSQSLLSSFSFYIAHNIQAGEMGVVNTDDYEIYRLIKKIKANGRLCDCEVCTRNVGVCPGKEKYKNYLEDFDPRFTHDLIGYNFKTMEFQAALGLVQLKKVHEINRKRQENVKYLNEGLEKYSDKLQLPFFSKKISYLAYPLVLKKGISRLKLREGLENCGIETRSMFPCIPTQQPAYAYLRKMYEGKLPNAEYLGIKGLYVGCHQYLKQEDLDRVIKAFKKILK
ncbi:DegT/DnrJ/EryC1/StrS aminotransferase family protein [Candidatus Woesearchaeota archaeon]|nr:DegT/DnrJ/EryC1/StrS aminotransferase family protein [Candidatus Woesearchaeota archaeon]